MSRAAAKSAAGPVAMMVVIPLEGDVRVESMPDQQELLTTLRDRIGCHLVEAVGATVNGLLVTVWCDEEGAMEPYPEMNVRIVRAFVEGGNPALHLVGTVVLTGGPDRYGNTLGLPSELARDLADRLNQPMTPADLFSVFKGLTHPALRSHQPDQ